MNTGLKLASASIFGFFAAMLLLSFKTENPISSTPFDPVQNRAFVEGEKLKYRLHYGFIDAGEAVIEIKKEARMFGGRSTYHAVGTGYSKGAFDWFFKVRDRYETFIDREALVPMAFFRRVDEGGYKINQNQVFNHYKNEVISNGEVFKVPSGVQDMLSAFYFARTINFDKASIGQIFTVNSFVDNEIFPLKIKFAGREVIRTDVGKIRCLKFRPVIQKGRVFKNEEDLAVWISDDLNHIPLCVEAELLVGSIKMDIMSCEGLANPLALSTK